MSSQQVTVRRRRLIPKGAYTSEEVEFTATVDKPQDVSVEEAIRTLNGTLDSILEREFPFPHEDKDEYSALSWKQSRKRPELSTQLVSGTLPERARELYDKLKTAKTVRTQYYEYHLSITEDGREFLQRWRLQH
jgi:hypothetical protein